MLVTASRAGLIEPDQSVAPGRDAPASSNFRHQSTRALVRRRRVMACLVASVASAGLIGAWTNVMPAWIVFGAALSLAVGYQVLAAYMRSLVADREMTKAFGPRPSFDAAWDGIPREREVNSCDNDVPVSDRTENAAPVARFAVSLLLFWVLAPAVCLLRLVRGASAGEDEGLLGFLLRAQQQCRSRSLRIVGISVVATAGATAIGIATPAGAVSHHYAPNPSIIAATVHPAVASKTAGPERLVPSGHDVSTYSVQAGDTLSAIAAQYGTTVSNLVTINRIADPNLIFVGQVVEVQLPAYKVLVGDTLGTIASRFGLTVTKLAATNGISNPNSVGVGRMLNVGGGKLPPVVVSAPQEYPVTETAPATPRTTTVESVSTPAVAGSVSRPARPDTHVTAPVAEDAPPLIGSGTYTVEVGDTLFGLAATFDTTVETLVQANRLTSDTIYVGQVLQVGGQGANARQAPKASKPPGAAPAHARTNSPPASPPRTVPLPAPPKPVVTTRATSSSSPAIASSSSNVQSFAALESCIIRAESSGNPEAWSADHQYWGLFQFSEPTWVEYGGAASAWGNAPAAVQEAVFTTAIDDGGATNWTPYDGC